MVGHKCLSNLTHIIVDEIHERDCLSDYLLISLRDILKSYKKLKVILMSAALNVDLFTSYFGKCPFIHVNGSTHDVKTFFLEDILKQTGYLNKGMRKMLQDDDRSLFKIEEKSTAAEEVMKLLKDDKKEETKEDAAEEEKAATPKEDVLSDGDHHNASDVEVESDTESENEDSQKVDGEGAGDGAVCEEEDDDVEIEKDEDDLGEDEGIAEDLDKLDIDGSDVDENDDEEDNEPIGVDEEDEDDAGDGDEQNEESKNTSSKEMDTALAQAWLNGDDEAFDQIIHLIMNENVNIDYQHSDTKMTSLIVAAARGNQTLTEQLIELGAKLDIRDPNNNRDALEWANHFSQNHVVEYLKGVSQSVSNDSSATLDETSTEEDLTENDKRRLELYHKSFDDQRVDISLILCLLGQICQKQQLKGSILIFLPGYDEIVSLRDKLKQDKEFSKRSKYQVLMLHSMLPPGNQRKVFGRPPSGVQKIILSTNIAETGITIDDVVCVIDSGKVKEKSHDAISCVSTLRTVWISKASAIQRRGRAGRCLPGICYHLFSQDRFHHFQTYQDAEMLRVPIHALCLQTKMLAPVNVSITDYLGKAPEPPSNLITRSSIKMLKAISALDENEEMTDLGKLLIELPIDPQFGKMILIGMSLKCLEPSIIIACCSSYKEPFLLPNVASQKSSAANAKLKLSSDSYSDQIAMLRAFQGWQRAKREGKEKVYCARNFISLGTMEMVSGMRRQIIGLLRSLGLVRMKGPGNMRDLNTNSRNWSIIKAVVGSGLYPNFIKVDKENKVLVSEKEKKVTIHNSSVLVARSEDKVQSTVSRANKLNSTISSLPLNWLVYEELSRLYYSVQIRSVSVLSSVAVALIGGPCLSYDHSSLRLKSSRNKKGRGRHGNDRGHHKDNFFQESDSEEESGQDSNTASFKIDDWMSFTGDDSTLYALAMLRIKFLALFSKHIQIPSKPWTQADSDIVQAIADVLIKEEQVVGLVNPATKDIEKRRGYERKYERYDRPRGRGRGGGPSRPYARREYNSRYERRYHGRDAPPDADAPENDGKLSDHESTGGNDEKRRERSYFILKCNNEKNMGISFDRSIWATTKSNEKRLHRAFKDSEEVYLVFSVQGSGRFQGVAKMISGISDKQCEDFGSANLGGVFDIEWIHQEELPFQATQHLANPWNDNKKVQISRDAQELEPSVGKALVNLWDKDGGGAPANADAGSTPRDERAEVSSPDEQLLPTSDEVSPQQQQEFYPPQEIYAGGSAPEGENQPYVEEYPMYSPPPFSPQFIPDFQQVPAHYAPAPHMGYQQSPYPAAGAPAMYAQHAPPQGNMPAYRQQEYYSFQYSPPRRGVDVYQRQESSEQKMRGGYRS
ncbi:3'-5' RNA helicase YTHDC2-like [Clytia hemisphaerica]|uniref:Uncharacterized protein n=1 Tax=Clytia hemisphaerica TaxID=252671 RepID=A0A7M5U2T1_9CNID